MVQSLSPDCPPDQRPPSTRGPRNVKVVLTDARIAGLPAPKSGSGRVEIGDRKVPGLFVRITSDGTKSFTLRGTIKGGSTVRLTLGQVGKLTLDAARQEARLALNAMAQGVDPRAEKAIAKARRRTLSEIAEEYIDLHRHRLKASYRDDIAHLIRRELAPLADRPVVEIDGPRVVNWHQSFKSRALADRARRVLRALLRYASD